MIGRAASGAKYGIATSYTGFVGLPSLGNLTMAPGTRLNLGGGGGAGV